ncbi:hypothetical protein [Burkholderia ubonensis]|uniref:hypothetical protein n=1 Tax=Burkholderia ubonensis TaxID=101571 RepID=UPI0007558CDA|nr:hypothetical protein [Burkholderia ubonensis]KWK75781.1 hypothetical protein WM15_29750 [Burkholderia ubonensis]
MSIRTLAARGLSFAHLAGLSSRAARAETDDDERKQREGESDDDYAKRMEEKDKEEEKARKAEEEREKEEAKKAEEERKKEEEARARGEDDQDSDLEADDDDEEMQGKSASARARKRERARCAAIFASPAAARNPVLAANLAFKTRMKRSEAIATLEATPAPASAAHVNRAARNPNLGADGGPKPSQQQALAARWDKNLQAANPGRRR